MASVLILLLLPGLARSALAAQVTCNEVLSPVGLPINPGGNGASGRLPADTQPDLLVDTPCTVKPGKYYFGEVNVIKGGTLTFEEGAASLPKAQNTTEFWAKSIIIENGGAMKAGVGAAKPYGTNGGELDIVLYGADQSAGNPMAKPGAGALCVSPPFQRGVQSKAGEAVADCGIPPDVWQTNGSRVETLRNDAPDGGEPVKDYFYQYGGLFGDTALTNGRIGHFGYKELALSYGGTLELRGNKGAPGGALTDPRDSGRSWLRLAADVATGGTELKLNRKVRNNAPNFGDWQVGDRIVVTTTDYVPDHSEELTITGFKDDQTVTVSPPLQWRHNGRSFDVASYLTADDKTRLKGMDPVLQKSAETRAAVALLTRSIRIISGGDSAGETFAAAIARDPHYSFGGQTVFRQGFARLQIQGVEFHELGEGGRLGHYPVHFHMARNVPHSTANTTYIKDSSVNDSMTRWFVLHSTNDVELWRNVGWKSIGHGYYLENGTETDNKLFSNIGILARAAVVGPDNPRGIPGILAQNEPSRASRFRSDVVTPTVFWVTNGWNQLVGNMAAGAGTCGSCYWYVPVASNDMVEVGAPGQHQNWTGYSTEQAPGGPGSGTTPIKQFLGNYCTGAMSSLNTVGDPQACNGVADMPDGTVKIQPIQNKLAPSGADPQSMYYPNVGSLREPTICDPTVPNDNARSCFRTPKCSKATAANCTAEIIDHYTTSFNWSETNFSAVWLRGGWYVFDNGFISDVQNGGITLITGGDYSRSSTPLGYWGLVSHSVLVGQTQPQDAAHPFTDARGPCAALECDRTFGDTRISRDHSVAYPLSNWATYERLFNVYDGPAYQDANAYLNIRISECDKLDTCMYYSTPGVRRWQPGGTTGYLPNAAIGWKQPNGFYYPPAFNSRNLVFQDVDIRHFVITPVMTPGTYRTDLALAGKLLFGVNSTTFNGFTDVDRQTVLNDDDGTLTGFKDTISVNDDPALITGGKTTSKPFGFFGAPIQASECESNKGVGPTNACGSQVPPTPPSTRTSPYEYLTTVIYPGCAVRGPGVDENTACGTYYGAPVPYDNKPGARYKDLQGRGGLWSKDCAGPFCTGVQLYRQVLTDGRPNEGGAKANDREWQSWVKNGCDKDATQPACDFPFIRMAGASQYQRSTLTANGETYYLDTTHSQDEQRKTGALGLPTDPLADYVECQFKTATGNCSPRSVNVFQGGQTYYMFFLYAKKDTKQTYQIYVGDNFNPESDVKGIRVTETSAPFQMADWPLPPAWKQNMTMISAKPGGPKDILQITVDFGAAGVPNLDPKQQSAGGICKPSSFCGGSGSDCHCTLDFTKEPWLKFSPTLAQTCKDTCKTWAVNDLDCPSIGCLGFSFTLKQFTASNQYKRPAPTPGFIDKSPWNVPLVAVDKALAGACFHTAAQTPGKGSCTVPN